MELATIFRLLVSKIWILIIIPVVAAVAGYLFSLTADKKFRSTVLLTTGFTTNEKVQIADERIDLWVAGVKFDNMIERMNSELVLSMVTYHLMVHDLTSRAPFRTLGKEDNPLANKSAAERKAIVDIFEQKIAKMEMLSSFDPKENELIELTKKYGYTGWLLKKTLTIYRARSTDFVEINFISENPLLSAFIVNTLSEQYIRYDSSLKTDISDESVKFFSELVTEKKKILDEKTIFLDKFKSSNNLFGEDFVELKSTQIVDYELMRQEKLDEIRSKKLSIADVNDQINNFTGKGSPNSAETNTTILQIRSKINDLNQIYVSGGSKDEELLKTITGLRSQLKDEMNKLAASGPDTDLPSVSKDGLLSKKRQLELELEITQTNLASLEQTINSLKSSVSGSASKKSTIESLERDVKTASDEYLQALEKYNTEKNKSLLSKSAITISQRGQPNGTPESSKTILIIGLSSVASFLLCAFVIVLIEFLDQRIKNPAKFEAYSDLKLIGWINSININNLDLKSLFSAKTENDSLEKFKHFLRKIRFELENSGAKVLLITSTKKGEGKTFIILSLAYSLSLLNKKSLIIDTNFRNNSLTKLLIAKPNFQKMLQEENDIKLLTSPLSKESDHVNSNIISQTSDKNIDVIGSNTGSESPSEILAGRDFNNMIERLRKNYDYIFLEGASLNDFSDTKELMLFADKVITVFSASSTLKEVDRESINYIKSLNGTLMGAILNKVESKDMA